MGMEGCFGSDSARRGLAALGLVAALGAGPVAAEYPTGPVELIIPYTPGGGIDAAGRAIIQAMKDEGIVDFPVQITNMPGAAGQVGLNYLVENARGDDHTIMVHSTSLVNNPISQGTEIDHHDYTLIGRVFSEYVYVVVTPDSPFDDIKQVAEALQQNPSGLRLAGASVGGASHQVIGKFANAIGVDPKQLNYVPYDGGEALAATLGGHVDVLFPGPEILDLIEGGQLIPLAVTSEERLSGRSADIPTFREKGYDVVYLNWRALIAPPDISPDAREFWVNALEDLAASDGWKQVLADREWTSTLLTGGFSEWLDSQHAETKAVLQSLGLTN